MNALAEISPLERSYDQSRQEFDEIVRSLDSDEARSMTHNDLERELEKKRRELMRKLLQEHLESRGPGECAQAVRGSDGVERSRVRSHERKLETIFGTVSVERAGYGQKGSRSLHPLDAEFNLPGKRYSLELCRRVAEESAKSSFDETLESINKYTGAHVPKRQIEEIVMRSAQDFDAFYEMRQGDTAADKRSGSIMR